FASKLATVHQRSSYRGWISPVRTRRTGGGSRIRRSQQRRESRQMRNGGDQLGPPPFLPLPPLHSYSRPPTAFLSIHHRLADRRECVARPVEPRLDRAEVAFGDLGDLLVRLALELAKHEHLAMMLRQASHGLLDEGAKMAASEHVVRTGRGVLELE